MHYELIEENIAKRGTVVNGFDIDLAPRHHEAYVSMFGFDQTIYDHLRVAKNDKGQPTVTGFKGFYGLETFYLDIDSSEDVKVAHGVAKSIIQALYELLDIHPDSIRIYFSGNKGFHIGLPAKLFGGIAAAKDLPEQVNTFAIFLIAELFGVTLEDIQAAFKENAAAKRSLRNYNSVDLGIYNANRIFRLPNSLHAKSNLYKYCLTYDQVTTLEIEEIAALATKPSPNRPTPKSKIKPSEKLKTLWERSLSFDTDSFKAISRTYTTGEGNFFAPAAQGARNNTLFAQACMLFDKSEFHETAVRDILTSINIASGDPLPDDELTKIVRSAASRTAMNRVTVKEEKKPDDVLNFGQAAMDYVDYYAQDYKRLTCLFPEIDEDQEERFGGKIAAFIGSRGTMKSYGVQNVIAQNITQREAIAACSSMEMAIHSTTGRFLDLFGRVNEEKDIQSPSRKIRQSAFTATEFTRAHVRENYSKYANKLILEAQAFRTAKDYCNWLDRISQLYQKPDILVVDGLAMMGGDANETTRFSENTAELKEIAKTYDLFIPIICHTNQGADEYTRDSRAFIRGSGKILDNVDFMVCFSKLIDPESTKRNVESAKGLGHVFYYDKRETGNFRRFVFNIHPLTNLITESAYSPDTFPLYDDLSDGTTQAHKPKKNIYEF